MWRRGRENCGNAAPNPPPKFVQAASKPASWAIFTTSAFTDCGSPNGYAKAHTAVPKTDSSADLLPEISAYASSGANSDKMGWLIECAPTLMPHEVSCRISVAV